MAVACFHCGSPYRAQDNRCPACGAYESVHLHNHRGEAVTFDRGASYRAVINSQLQRPEFNSRGAALAFAHAVLAGTRRAEPVLNKEVNL